MAEVKEKKEKKPQVNITFKQKEMDMYEYLKSKSSPANFIKDLVKAHMNGIHVPTDHKPPTQEEFTNEDNEVVEDKNDDIIVNGLEEMNMFMDEFQ